MGEARDKRRYRRKDHKEQTTVTRKSILLMSKGPLSKEGHRHHLLDMSVHTGGIIALLYSLNKYIGLPIIYNNVEKCYPEDEVSIKHKHLRIHWLKKINVMTHIL